MTTAFAAIIIFWSLAIYVITRDPKRSINWVFGIFCFSVVNYYLSSLFLYPPPRDLSLSTPFPLRWKWAVTVFGTTSYLHLVSFYFPSIWQRYRLAMLSLAYLISSGLALAALFTNLLVAGSFDRPPPHTIGPLPGPLMLPYAGFFLLEVIVGIAGLVAGYRATMPLDGPGRVRTTLEMKTLYSETTQLFSV